MNKGECFVDIVEAFECVNDLIFHDEITQEILYKEGEELKRGALCGMSWAILGISSHCPSYIFNNKENKHESKTDC